MRLFIGMNSERIKESGFALPAALFMCLAIAAVTTIITMMSRFNLSQIKTEENSASTYYIAEGAMNKLLGEMSVYGPLWDSQASLASSPSGYTEYSPAAYTSSNGIPSCSGQVSCHRNMYPNGGGLLKNLGPLTGDGATVDTTYSVTQQLDFSDPPTADITLGGLSGWVQVERLDETTPSASTVGGSLSSSIAEGGNAKLVRYRVTGLTMKRLRGKVGTSTVVGIIQIPAS